MAGFRRARSGRRRPSGRTGPAFPAARRHPALAAAHSRDSGRNAVGPPLALPSRQGDPRCQPLRPHCRNRLRRRQLTKPPQRLPAAGASFQDHLIECHPGGSPTRPPATSGWLCGQAAATAGADQAPETGTAQPSGGGTRPQVAQTPGAADGAATALAAPPDVAPANRVQTPTRKPADSSIQQSGRSGPGWHRRSAGALPNVPAAATASETGSRGVVTCARPGGTCGQAPEPARHQHPRPAPPPIRRRQPWTGTHLPAPSASLPPPARPSQPWHRARPAGDAAAADQVAPAVGRRADARRGTHASACRA